MSRTVLLHHGCFDLEYDPYENSNAPFTWYSELLDPEAGILWFCPGLKT
jgi:hypothetical protein